MPELVMCSYCGMRMPLMKGDLAACHAKARRIRDRHDGPITVLSPTEWELESPDDAGSIGDMDGILRIVPDKSEPETDEGE